MTFLNGLVSKYVVAASGGDVGALALMFRRAPGEENDAKVGNHAIIWTACPEWDSFDDHKLLEEVSPRKGGKQLGPISETLATGFLLAGPATRSAQSKFGVVGLTGDTQPLFGRSRDQSDSMASSVFLWQSSSASVLQVRGEVLLSL